jgi:hypothetical protein
MTTEEPMANLSWNQEQFTAYLLGLTEKRIAEEERMFQCSACLACQWTTCRKAGAFRYSRLLPGKLEATR